MFELTEKEIEKISCDIDRQGLTYTRLKNELLDHICCCIEEEMENGMTFNDAYRKVKQQVGSRRIRQIQDETLYLVSKKYRKMKKTMVGLGIAIPIIIVVAMLFKLLHWPGAGIMFTLALFALAIVFLPIFAMVKIRDTRQQNEPVPLGFYLIGMIGGMLTIIGSLFKIQHMAGASVMLSAGLVVMALVFLPTFAILKIRSARARDEPVNKTYYILGVIAGVLFIAGAQFKIMHWPGAGIIILVSWMAVALVLLPLLVLNILQQKENRLNNFLLVVLAFSFISLLILSQLRRPSRIMIDSLLYSEQNTAGNSSYFSNVSDRIMQEAKGMEDPDMVNRMQTIRNDADELCGLIRKLQVSIISSADEANKEAVRQDGSIDYPGVKGKDRDYPSIEIMLVSGDAPNNATVLKEAIESFKAEALSITRDPGLQSYINKQLDLSPDFEDETWEDNQFRKSLMESAMLLSMYHSTVRIIEYGLLNEIFAGMKE